MSGSLQKQIVSGYLGEILPKRQKNHDMPQPQSPVQSIMPLPKIVFVRQKFSRFGGGELILDRTIAALAGRGVPVSMISRSWEQRDGVSFQRCDPPRFPRASRDSRFARAACSIIANSPGTLVQSHERLSCCDIYRAGDGVHAAYLAHRARNAGALKRLFQRMSLYHRDVLRLEREMFASPRLKAVIVNSQMVADEIVEHYNYPRERLHFIPNGIELSRFEPSALAALRGETRKRLGISDDRKIAIIVGSGYERKGVAQAIGALAKSSGDAMLLVIGQEKRVSRYESFAKGLSVGSRIIFFGRQENVLPFLAAADAMILPSIYDPFPSSVLEGLAAGLPVVTSQTCGARDVVREIDPRLVRDANDIAGLGDALSIAFALSEKSETKTRAHEIAARYDMNKMVERILSLYETLGQTRQ